MANLSRQENFFQDLFDFRRDFDHLFNRFLTGSPVVGGTRGRVGEASPLVSFAPAVESYVDRQGKKFVCRVALPDIDPKEVTIQVHSNMLTITGERKVKNEQKEADYVQSELMYGYFERTVPLPEGVEPGKVDAEYRNGVLEITAPIAAAALPRKVEVKSAEPGAKQIGASASGR
ncbi:MAG TPA: Hsp20/alpha crystallin family protein [Candidatus Cybelea sp.]|nr:Hsp20/alpha crystallin family protein [Candidatus Cybelea sp.]